MVRLNSAKPLYAPALHRSEQDSKQPAKPTSNRQRLFAHLHRGGSYAHFWSDLGNRSLWFRVDVAGSGSERILPNAWLAGNVYFSVHPLSQIPPHNTNGKTNPHYISSQLPYITAINTLFAEYDGKDFVTVLDYKPLLPDRFASLSRVEQELAIQQAKTETFYRQPARYKVRAWNKIETLDFPPSVVVDSGGGYHAYWLLRETLAVDEANRTEIQVIQHAWVQMVGGDAGASDLRRVLRVPGSYNRKSGFGDIAPRVTFAKVDFDLLYEYRALEEVVNDWLFAQQPTHRPTRPPASKKIVDQADRTSFNQQHSLVDILTAHGYHLCSRGPTGARLARPGSVSKHPSITVFPAQPDGRPELSIHFSTNDPLYCAEYLDPNTKQMRRHAHDAYRANRLLEQVER